jgi:hypothetical protein
VKTKNDYAVAARLALSWPGNPLLDDASAEICFDTAILRATDRVHERSVADPLPSGEALEPSRFENSRDIRGTIQFDSIVPGTIFSMMA